MNSCGFSPNFTGGVDAVKLRKEDRMNCYDDNCAEPLTLNERFRKFAVGVSKFAGTPVAFTISFIVIILWAILGPVFHYSDSWQLVINTGTTIITFLMVFLIQNMQNRDAKAIHLKLDELIRAIKGARNNLVMLENLSEEELANIEKQFARLAERHRTEKNGSNESHAKAA
jgi:low affinity Fe/Cu permease